jgi:hypothetical protein
MKEKKKRERERERENIERASCKYIYTHNNKTQTLRVFL